MLKSKIKAIPRDVKAKIKAIDQEHWNYGTNRRRWYAYLDTNNGELVKVTCAVRGGEKSWQIMQTSIHGVATKDKCFVNNMKFTYVGGYNPIWSDETYWWEAEANFFDVAVHFIVNQDKILDFPQYKYCGYDQAITSDVIGYLRMYEEYPEIEYLVKQGLSMYWNSKATLSILRKDKKFRQYLVAHKGVKPNVMINAYKNGLSIEEAQAEERIRRQGYAVIAKTYKGECVRVERYLRAKDINYSVFKDYVIACNALGLDMTDTKNRYPDNFKRWHDVRIDEYATLKAMKDAEERKGLYEQFAAVADKYRAMQVSKDGYAVVIARSPAELIKEGEVLHHCVGKMGYDQKFVREESLIFFVRCAEHKETPWLTMEYDLKRNDIVQIHGDNNESAPRDVKTFLYNEWMPKAKKELKKIG